MERIVVGALLAIHGFVHLRLWWFGMETGRESSPRHSWLLGDLGVWPRG